MRTHFKHAHVNPAAGRSDFYYVFLSSSGSIRISSQPCLQGNSRNNKSQILPSHRIYKIPLTNWRLKGEKRQKKTRGRTKQVCISGGGSEKNTIRLTVAMVTGLAACQSWTTVWICSREVAALLTCSFHH